jgi:hypothetical protein
MQHVPNIANLAISAMISVENHAAHVKRRLKKSVLDVFVLRNLFVERFPEGYTTVKRNVRQY